MKRTLLMASVCHAAADVGGSAVELENAAVAVASVSAEQREAEAVRLASLADTNDDLQAALERSALSKEENLMSPVKLYFFFRDTYGQALDSFPVPGSKEEDGANNPDIYKRPSRQKGAGGQKMANATWTNDFTASLKWVREDIIKVIEDNDIAEAAKVVSPMKAAQVRNKYNARLASARVAVKRAIGLHHQIAAIEGYPAVKFEWVQEEIPILDDKGQPKLVKGVAQTEMVIEDCNAPIILESTTNPKKDWAELTIQQFLSLKVVEARGMGGTYANLISTMARGGGADDESGDGIAVNTVDEAISTFAAEAIFLTKDVQYRALRDRLEKKDDDTDHELLSMNVVYEKLGSLLGRHSKRIEALEAKQKALANADAA